MSNNKPLPLNIPKDKDQFASVPFVETMTSFQLKVMIKRLHANIQEVANLMDWRRADVAQVLDDILDGKPINKKILQDRYVYGKFKEHIIRYDTYRRRFELLDDNYQETDAEPIQGVTLAEAKGKVTHRKKPPLGEDEPVPARKVPKKARTKSGLISTIEKVLKRIG